MSDPSDGGNDSTNLNSNVPTAPAPANETGETPRTISPPVNPVVQRIHEEFETIHDSLAVCKDKLDEADSAIKEYELKDLEPTVNRTLEDYNKLSNATDSA
jgi:hypothetical protein